jgi:DNA-binding transcriptional ArsR family regulator
MSAAVVVTEKRPAGRVAKTAPLPSWTDGSSPDFLHWLPIPVSFFEQAMRKISGLEAQILGLIARATYGDDRGGRPEWATDLPLTRFAQLTGAHKNGVAIAIDRLERAGAIESERVGRGKRYRVAVHKLASLKELEPEEATASADEDEDAEAASGSTAVVAKSDEPVIKLGKHTVPLSAVKFCQDCATKLIAAVRTAAEPTAAKSEQEANDCHTPVGQSAPIQAEKANEGRTIGTVECDNQADADIATLEQYLARRFAKKLGEAPPRRITEKAIFDLRKYETPLTDLLTRIEARKGVFNSWAFLGNLVVDVINAHAAAQRAIPKPVAAVVTTEPGLSMAERIRSHATGRIAEVERIAGAEKAVESLIWINQNAAKLADNPSELCELLEAAEIVVADAIKAKLRKPELNAIYADAEAVVGPRKSKLTPTVYASEIVRFTAPLILKAAGIRRIAWTT